MTKVVAIMSMSLDGYVADANDGVDEVFDWYFSGDVEAPMPIPTPHFTFHTNRKKSAVDRAKSAAGPKSVAVHGSQTIQQCLDAGLLDEIHIDLAAVLLGAGVRLFDHLANTPVILGNPTVVAGVGVTHLRYPVHTS